MAKMDEQQTKAKLADFSAIKNLCTTAGHPDKATDYIAANKSVNFVRDALFDVLTSNQKDIDNSLSPQQQHTKVKPQIDTQAVYRKRNQQ